MNSLAPYFLWSRTVIVRDREIVDAVVAPQHRGPSAELVAALGRWRGAHYWPSSDGDGRLVLVRSLDPGARERWWLHGLLFLATFATVWMGGALLGGSPVAFAPFASHPGVSGRLIAELTRDIGLLRPGLDFAMALMAILLAHETGHYILARRYGINASPPYFLPAPPFVNFIGTFGAFIRLRSPIVDRQQLMDVGAAGPWAGFVVAMVALAVGLAHSPVVPDADAAQFVMLGHIRLALGDSPIMYAARQLIVGDGPVLLHPLAFAGWLGLFVTMLNLVPLGQLDGGHVLYALIGKRQAMISRLAWVGLIVMGFVSAREGLWYGMLWWVWAGLILMIGRGRLAHPQVLDRYRRLPGSRWPLGWATMLLFVGTFTPVPIHYF